MKLINLTPHTINLIVGDESKNYPASGIVARVSSTYKETSIIDGAVVFVSNFGEVIDLPSETEGVILIVSGMVRDALKGTRLDCVAPRTDATAIRNEQGQIVAVTSWRI